MGAALHTLHAAADPAGAAAADAADKAARVVRSHLARPLLRFGGFLLATNLDAADVWVEFDSREVPMLLGVFINGEWCDPMGVTHDVTLARWTFEAHAMLQRFDAGQRADAESDQREWVRL